MAAAFTVPLPELLFLCMMCTKGCYHTSRAVRSFLRGRILYSEYCFGDFFFSSLQMGGVEFVFKIYLLLCAKDGQDKFIFALRFEDDKVGVSPLAVLCCFL